MTGAEVVALTASVATIIAAVAVVVTVAIYFGVRLQSHDKSEGNRVKYAGDRQSYADNRELRQARYLMLEHSKTFEDYFSVPFSSGIAARRR